jgi:hypothetical protein
MQTLEDRFGSPARHLESPADRFEYRKILGSTPVRRTESERVEDCGIFVTPKRRKIAIGKIPDGILSDEIWHYVFKYLSLVELITVSKVSSRFYNISRLNFLWKRHYLNLFYGEKRHITRIGSPSCRFSLIDDQQVCTCVIHYINPKDGKEPRLKSTKYYEHTLERIYYLSVKSLEEYKKDINTKDPKKYISPAQQQDLLKYTNDSRKILDSKFIWVFKKLYPSKYR